MSQTRVQPQPQQAPSTQVLDEPRIGGGSKACAAGAGVLGSVCCGGGLAAVIATSIGAGGAVSFMRTWGNMQGVTLISTGLAIVLVLALSWFVTRRARAGLAPAAGRHVFGRALFQLAAWALAGYFVYFIVINALLSLAGFEYAGEN